MYHEPVLLKETIDGLNIDPHGIYVDATFGGGGHARAILDHLTTGKLFAFDQDDDSIQNAPEDNRFLLINANFKYIKNFLRYYNAIPVNGILADLGVSSHQLNSPERGFSTRYDGDLDMKMDTRKLLDGKYIINNYPEDKLKMIFSSYGEIKNAFGLAAIIVSSRQKQEISTTDQLCEIALTLAPRGKENKYLAKVFQALRIEVNKEMNALRSFLVKSDEILVKGGRLVIIAYHSLEDRLVKNFIRTGNFTGRQEKDFFGNVLTNFKVVTKKPVVPDENELQANPRSRSAKLRIGEKI
jgi:16S rRNA (cytosine1402-N4)-methyltransferase